jgi:hypothetical protein
MPKVADSIPDEFTGFFNWRNPPSRTTALGSTQPLTEMSIRILPGDKGPARKAWQLHCHLWADCVENVGASTSQNPMGLHALLQGWLYLLYIYISGYHTKTREPPVTDHYCPIWSRVLGTLSVPPYKFRDKDSNWRRSSQPILSQFPVPILIRHYAILVQRKTNLAEVFFRSPSS